MTFNVTLMHIEQCKIKWLYVFCSTYMDASTLLPGSLLMEVGVVMNVTANNLREQMVGSRCFLGCDDAGQGWLNF